MKKDRSTALREANQRQRKKKRELGLVPLEVWVTPEHKKLVKEYANRLNEHALGA